MTWFRKNGQLVRKFKDEFTDTIISHAYFSHTKGKYAKKKIT